MLVVLFVHQRDLVHDLQVNRMNLEKAAHDHAVIVVQNCLYSYAHLSRFANIHIYNMVTH